MSLDPRIIYIISVPDSEPDDASPLQGFSPSLCRNPWLLRGLGSMPTDITDFAIQDREIRLIRHMVGDAPIWWTPLMPSAIKQIPFDHATPFTVLLVSPEDDLDQYMAWKSTCRHPPLIVGEKGGDTTFKNFNWKTVQEHCISVCSKLGSQLGSEIQNKILSTLENWSVPPEQSIGLEVDGHNAFIPNVMALAAAGYAIKCNRPFSPEDFGIIPFVDNILRTSDLIFQEREKIGDREIYKFAPLTPDLMLFAPSLYAHFRSSFRKLNNSPQSLKEMTSALHLLNKQKGYRIETTSEKLAAAGIKEVSGKADANIIFKIRQSELSLCTYAVGLLAASELSSVIRLPNEINHSSGQVRQFAMQKRGSNTQIHKRTKTFQDVQTCLAQATPRKFLDLIRRSKSGIRIIADAPMEWLDIDGVPLCITRNTSRIPVTPGNVLITQLISRPRLHLSPEAFSDILLVNATKDNDPIHPYFMGAINSYNDILKNKVKPRSVEVGSRQSLIDAINSFDGVFMIFNGHGSHNDGEPAFIWIKDEKVDVWSLKSDLKRIPPMILLSACDTQAADRNHATTATGFLTLGSTAVLGSFFPLLATEAAIFAARLMHRVAEFIPGYIQAFKRSITWSEVVGGMLRMTLLRDYLIRLRQVNLIDEAAYEDIHRRGNILISSLSDSPFEQVINAVIAEGVSEGQARKEFKIAVAISSAINYVHMGRPETIIFSTPELLYPEGFITEDAPTTGHSGTGSL